MIYDNFLFYNELDLLKIRLEILDPYVDFFVLTEADQTFMGKSKPLYYAENKNLFEKWNHKIIHNTVTNYPDDKAMYEFCRKSPNVGAGEHFWIREMFQKEKMIVPLKQRCKDNDIVYVSDLDEI